MRVLIVSDLHLGAPARLPQADGELSYLLQEPWDQVILLGDVFDLWLRPMREILKEHPTVIASLNSVKCPVIFVPGNHDSVFQGLDKLNKFQIMWPVHRFKSGDKWVAVAHGDAYDQLRGVKSWLGAWLGKIVDTIAGWILGPGVSIQRKFRYSYAERGPGRASYVQPIMEKAAADLDGDIVVIGHTHVPISPEIIDGKVVVNCGDFGPEHMTYVVVDEGKIELRTLDSE